MCFNGKNEQQLMGYSGKQLRVFFSPTSDSYPLDMEGMWGPTGFTEFQNFTFFSCDGQYDMIPGISFQ